MRFSLGEFGKKWEKVWLSASRDVHQINLAALLGEHLDETLKYVLADVLTLEHLPHCLYIWPTLTFDVMLCPRAFLQSFLQLGSSPQVLRILRSLVFPRTRPVGISRFSSRVPFGDIQFAGERTRLG